MKNERRDSAVIVSFGDKTTEAVFHGTPIRILKRFPADVSQRAIVKLDFLNGASDLVDLEKPPGNRLEALKGDLRGYHSIRVNDQWRIVFRWLGSDAHDVRLVDYHG
jgi:proteic killer suppression protein